MQEISLWTVLVTQTIPFSLSALKNQMDLWQLLLELTRTAHGVYGSMEGASFSQVTYWPVLRNTFLLVPVRRACMVYSSRYINLATYISAFCWLLVHRTGLCALTSKIIQLPLTTTAGVISLTTFGSINLCMSSHTIVPRSQRLFTLSSFLRGVGYSTADADGYGVWNRFPTHSHSLTGLF